MDGGKLCELVTDTTIMLRGQAMIEERRAGALRIIKIDEQVPIARIMANIAGMDADNVVIGVYVQRAEGYRQDLVSALKSALHDGKIERPATYVEIAGALDMDEVLAMRLLALGTHLGFWGVKRFRSADLIAASLLAIATIDPTNSALAAIFP